jgi:hypothetical protein
MSVIYPVNAKLKETLLSLTEKEAGWFLLLFFYSLRE